MSILPDGVETDNGQRSDPIQGLVELPDLPGQAFPSVHEPGKGFLRTCHLPGQFPHPVGIRVGLGLAKGRSDFRLLVLQLGDLVLEGLQPLRKGRLLLLQPVRVPGGIVDLVGQRPPRRRNRFFDRGQVLG